MSDTMERFKRLPLGNICDANGRRGSMDQGIRPLDPNLHMAGRAYTVRCHPGDNLAIHKAIQEAPDGSVLVIDAGGYTGGGHIGEIMCFACMQRGIRGLVIDGSCRDADDICELGFPVFSRGLCPPDECYYTACFRHRKWIFSSVLWIIYGEYQTVKIVSCLKYTKQTLLFVQVIQFSDNFINLFPARIPPCLKSLEAVEGKNILLQEY